MLISKKEVDLNYLSTFLKFKSYKYQFNTSLNSAFISYNLTGFSPVDKISSWFKTKHTSLTYNDDCLEQVLQVSENTEVLLIILDAESI